MYLIDYHTNITPPPINMLNNMFFANSFASKYSTFAKKLSENMETFTEKEIFQQPNSWLKAYGLLCEQQGKAAAFLHRYLTSETEVVLTGAGTSAFIGDAIAPVLRKIWGNVRAVATTDIVTNGEQYLRSDKPLLLISFARSGNSPESVAAVNIANKICSQAAHIYITCNAQGHLALTGKGDNILTLLLPEETDDKSLAMTSSFSTMLLTCLLLSQIDHIEQERNKVEAIALNAQAVLNQYTDALQAIARHKFERGVFLGSGALKGIAEECHLKLQELTDGGVVCKFDSFLGFRHGPKAVVNSKTILVYLMSDQEPVQRYERDLVEQINSNNSVIAQVIVTAGSRVEMPKVQEDLQVVMPHGSDETGIYSILPYVLVGQLLGFYTSLQRGLCPDSPSVSGNIHRVVEGVKIYE